MKEGIHNPWKAACPDDDGSSVRRAAFGEEEIGRVLAEAKRVGHDWYLASMIALYTGLRYGDVARLDWNDVDMERGIITVTPNKTKKSSGVTVTIPIAAPLRAALDLLLGHRGGAARLRGADVALRLHGTAAGREVPLSGGPSLLRPFAVKGIFQSVDFRIGAVVQWLRSVRVHPLGCVCRRNHTAGKETA